MMSIGAFNWRFFFGRSKGRSSRVAVDCASSAGREEVEASEAD